MQSETLLIILVIVIIILVGYKLLFNDKNKDTFLVLMDDETTRNNRCFEYLLYDGSSYYLFDSRIPIDGIQNPMKFASAGLANEYLKIISNNGVSGCTALPVIDLRANKVPFDSFGHLLDPQVNYERECNKKLATYMNHLGMCLDYSKTDEEYKKYLAITNDTNQLVNYDLESCMGQTVKDRDPDLLGTTSIDQFLHNSAVNILGGNENIMY
jgi:hypothetical protein